jgi:hypothetical protein
MNSLILQPGGQALEIQHLENHLVDFQVLLVVSQAMAVSSDIHQQQTKDSNDSILPLRGQWHRLLHEFKCFYWVYHERIRCGVVKFGDMLSCEDGYNEAWGPFEGIILSRSLVERCVSSSEPAKVSVIFINFHHFFDESSCGGFVVPERMQDAVEDEHAS